MIWQNVDLFPVLYHYSICLLKILDNVIFYGQIDTIALPDRWTMDLACC